MDFNTYQAEALKTAIYPNVGDNFTYPTLGLAGEAGELSNKVKKIIRDKLDKTDDKVVFDIENEIGDILWYAAVLAMEFGLSLDEIAVNNLFKLHERQNKNTLHGEGDSR
jgi:NTP pyrophosphatase (non-canonical NTP hydrolase)